jgi:hypothetical protein
MIGVNNGDLVRIKTLPQSVHRVINADDSWAMVRQESGNPDTNGMHRQVDLSDLEAA